MASLIFDEQQHKYFADGVELPSVTQIIRFLNYDTAEGAKTWLRDVAADRGKRIHEYCMLADFGELPEDNEIDFDCIGYVQAYKAFLRDYKPSWTHIEIPLASAKHGYAGTIDRAGTIDWKPAILDIKSGSKVNKAATAAQLTGYETLLIENGDTDFTGENQYLCLHLCKDKTYKVYRLKRTGLFFECLGIHKELKTINGGKL